MKRCILILFWIGFGIAVWGQTLQLKVEDTSGTALVQVLVSGQPQGWARYTNFNGIVNIPAADTIYFQYLGFLTQSYSWVDLQKKTTPIQLSANNLLPTITVNEKALQRDQTQQVHRILARQIQALQPTTPVDALAQNGGIFVQKSQLGGGSPILRGFEANRVLLVVDHVRMNNAIYRSGHLQNAITVDENALSAIEVKYGSGSLSHGSDALGGVIHFKTKNPLPFGSTLKGITQWSGSAGVRYGSAAEERTLQGTLSCQTNNWSTFTAITATKFGDLRAGSLRPGFTPQFGQRHQFAARINDRDTLLTNSQLDRQIGSAYEQLDLLQKITWQPTTNWQWQLNLQYSTSSDIPRYDRLTERRNGQLRFAEWYYGPQNRLLAALQAHWQPVGSWADQVRMILSRQWIAEDRYERLYQSDWREQNLVGVTANNFTFDAQKSLNFDNKSSSLHYGFDLRHEEVEAQADRLNLVTGMQVQDINTRYPSQGSTLSAGGLYAQWQLENTEETWQLELGGRLSFQRLEVKFGQQDPINWPVDYVQGLAQNNWASNVAFGIMRRMGDWQLASHIATGFRTPNIDDFAKFREKNGFLQIPNPALLPERTRTIDIRLTYEPKPGFRVQGTVFHTWLLDAMVRKDFRLPDGSPQLINGVDTLFVQALVNADRGRIWGAQLQGRWHPIPVLQFKGQLVFTTGQRSINIAETTDQTTVPLDHIPPLFGQIACYWTWSQWQLQARFNFQAAKPIDEYAVSQVLVDGDELLFNRSGTSDNLEQTPFSSRINRYTGSYAWWTLGLHTTYQIQDQWRLRLSINNIFDYHYRTFSSGISAPGRDIVIGIYNWF